MREPCKVSEILAGAGLAGRAASAPLLGRKTHLSRILAGDFHFCSRLPISIHPVALSILRLRFFPAATTACVWNGSCYWDDKGKQREWTG